MKKIFKILNRIIIEGTVKPSLFRREIIFEVEVYYTPIKNIIVEINTKGIELSNKKLKINFKKGDNISLVKEWCLKNDHKIIFSKNKN